MKKIRRKSRLVSILVLFTGLLGCSLTTREADTFINFLDVSGQSRKLHIFTPDGAAPSQGWPIMIFFHGGAWKKGGARQFYRQCSVLRTQGILCISAEYGAQIPHNDFVEKGLRNAYTAVVHILNNAQKLNINTKELVLAGGSAGGHIATMLSIGYNGLKPIDAKALVLFNPMLDLSPGKPDHDLVRDYWQKISPQHQLKKALPTTLIMLGTKDKEVPVSVAEAFCKKAIALGSDCQLALTEGQRHAFFNYNVSRWNFYKTLWEIRQFLSKISII